MSVLRTPDQRFANLPGYPFPPNYVAVQAKGIDRNVIHVLRDAGLRVIAPDHIGVWSLR